MKRDFKGVWIPRDIWLDQNLTWTEKLLLVEIDSLARNGECFASNAYFAEFFSLSKDRISRVVASLRDKGYVSVSMTYKKGTKQVDKRIITPIGYRREHRDPIGENTDTPISENAEDNNTDMNNTVIKKERKKGSKPSSYDEAIEGYTENEDLKTALKEFVKMRKMMKSPLTDRALSLLLGKLDKMEATDAGKTEVVNQSIERGWKGFFPLKDKETPKKENKPSYYEQVGDTEEWDF